MKSLKKYFAIAVVFLAFSAFSYGEEIYSEKDMTAFDFNNEAGLTFTLGENKEFVDLDYFHYFNSSFALGTQLWAAYGRNYYGKDDEKTFSYLVNLEADFVVYRTKMNEFFSSQFFFWMEGGYNGKAETLESNGTISTTSYNSNVTAGLGIGYDLIAYNHFVFPMKIGFMGNCLNDYDIDFVFSSGLNYRF